MWTFRHRRPPGSDILLGRFPASPPPLSAGAELLEDDVLFSPSPDSSPCRSEPSSPRGLRPSLASPSSGVCAIPSSVSKPKPEYALSVPRESEVAERVRWDEDGEMVPPHEMVGRRSAVTSLSVLEGAGRTLKGRDLRRVRNAVFRQTGFLD